MAYDFHRTIGPELAPLMALLFAPSDKPAPFPSELCTIPDPKEEGIFTSDQKFLCLIVGTGNTMWDRTEITIRVLTPYVHRTTEEEAGDLSVDPEMVDWTDPGGNWISHCELSIHYDDKRVIRFVPIPDDFQFVTDPGTGR